MSEDNVPDLYWMSVTKKKTCVELQQSWKRDMVLPVLWMKLMDEYEPVADRNVLKDRYCCLFIRILAVWFSSFLSLYCSMAMYYRRFVIPNFG